MKNVLKKVLALAMALALVLSMGAMTAFAADAEAESARLGIISAMSVELKALVEAAEIEKEETIAGNTFYIGTLHGVDVVLVKGGVGKVLAASCTEMLIDTYHVGGIVFTGVAGGVGDEVRVMDMVIGTALVQHDYGEETNDGFAWNGKAAADAETGMIPVDEALSKVAYDSACAVLGAEKVHQGVIATGDQFISSESYVKELQDKFDALACEMEGASVARIADQFGVPCAVIRCMSDKADGIAHDTYEFNAAEAADTSAAVVMGMLDTIVESGMKLSAAKDDVEKDETPRMAIISAMKVELEALVEAAEIEKETVIGDKTFYVGTLNGQDVVMVQAGVGKVMASGGTAALLNNFTVDGVIFTGIAGGVGDDVNVMDMVIGTGMVQHDYGTETNDGFVWNGKAAADAETGMIPVDKDLTKVAYDAACKVLGVEKVHQGVIATGDQFIASETYVKELQNKFDALACEMEGAAVARVCDQYGIPCTVIRCMSDKADGIAHDAYAFNYTEASNTSASVVMGMMETLSAAPELPFTDVTEDDWCFDAVLSVYTDGLMSGISEAAFSPDAVITRGEIVTILWRLAGEPEVSEQEIAFTDVTTGAYYEEAVCWAAANEIVYGYEDGTFGAGDAVTWEQLVVILYRYAKVSGADTSATGELGMLAELTGSYATEALSWAIADGIIMTDEYGLSSVSTPKSTATRAQVATTLMQYSEKIA